MKCFFFLELQVGELEYSQTTAYEQAHLCPLDIHNHINQTQTFLFADVFLVLKI